jgi:hypothetical protein
MLSTPFLLLSHHLSLTRPLPTKPTARRANVTPRAKTPRPTLVPSLQWITTTAASPFPLQSHPSLLWYFQWGSFWLHHEAMDRESYKFSEMIILSIFEWNYELFFIYFCPTIFFSFLIYFLLLVPKIYDQYFQIITFGTKR